MSTPVSAQAVKPPPFERHFVFLCSLLLLVSFVTSITEVIQLFAGRGLTDIRVTSGFRLLREAIYLFLLLDFMLCMLSASNKPLITRFSVLFCCFVASAVALISFYSILLGLPPLVILSGLRFLEYVPLALIAAIVYKSSGDRPFLKLSRVVLLFVLVESALGVIETRFPVPLWGETFIGTRSFGTFTSPDLFGPAMALCFLFLLALPRWRMWCFFIVLFDVFASGSRAGILGYFFLLSTYVFVGLRNKWSRLALITFGAFASPFLLILSTLHAFTGRTTGIGTGLGGYERLGVWAGVLARVNSFSDLAIGWGVGLGSNTVFSIYGGEVAGNYVSDNTLFFLLGSYGMVGIVLFSLALIVTTYLLRNDQAGFALMVYLALQMMIGQTLESYPINVLAMIVVGWRLAAAMQKAPALRQTLARPFQRPSRMPEMAAVPALGTLISTQGQ